MTQERATDEAFVIQPDGRICDLKRRRAMPTIREVQAVIGAPFVATDLDGRQGLALLHADEEVTEELPVNARATALVEGRTIRGPAVVIARRLVP
jgi:hypothetical protein